MTGARYHAISDDRDSKRGDTLKPRGKAFGKTAGDVLHERDWQGIAAANRREKLSESAGSASGGHDSHHSVAASGGEAGPRFPAPGVCHGARIVDSDAPPHEFHLAHDRELRTDTSRDRLIVGGCDASRFFQYRECSGLQRFYGDLQILAYVGGRYHDDGSGLFSHDPLRRFETIHSRQPDIHRDDVRRNVFEHGQSFFGAAGDGRDFEAGIAPDDVFEEFSHHFGIFR